MRIKEILGALSLVGGGGGLVLLEQKEIEERDQKFGGYRRNRIAFCFSKYSQKKLKKNQIMFINILFLNMNVFAELPSL